MALTQVPDQTALQRKWITNVNTGTFSVPTWTLIKGVHEANLQPHIRQLEDDSAFNDGDWASQTATQLAWTHEIKMLRRYNANDDTIYDPGQEKLRALARLLGPASVAEVQVYDREGGPEAYHGFAELEWKPDGGAKPDLEKVTVTMTGKGELEIITNPSFTPIPVPVVTSLTPATGTAAGGTPTVIIRGAYFIGVSGAAAVKFGANNATSYSVLDPFTIVAIPPAHAAGTVDVTVTNSTGTSATTGTGNDYVYV